MESDRLSRVWLLKIVKEYEHILYGYKIKGLKPANFRLSEGTTTLGTWNSETRTIALSRALISSAPWEVVCQVLRHEMAHQIADELLGGDEVHGPKFQAACLMIWVEPWARNPKIEMGDDLTESNLKTLDWSKFASLSQDPEVQKLRERLKKLLALSESSNPHEASIALSKAMKLQSERMISPTEGEQDFETRIIRPKKKRLERHYSKVGAILAKHYHVRIIYCREFDANLLESFQTMEILGPSQSVELAEHVYFFLLQTLETQFRLEQKKSPTPLKRKSYFDGILAGVSEQLTAQAKGITIPPSAKALALQSEALLNEYFSKRHPRILNRSFSGSIQDGGSFEMGKQKGRDLHIRPPVKSPSTLSIGPKGGF